MLTPRPSFVLVILLLLLAPLAHADVDRAALDAIFATWDRDDAPGCAVAVRRGDDVIYHAGFGQAILEYDAPITPDTVFHIASVSKQVTAFAVALLAADGALDLEDDIRAHVPECPDFGAVITLRDLIHHQSGLRDQWDLLVLAGWRMEDVITRDDAMELITAQRELNFEPGTSYLYCNTGYTLLTLVVERVSGQTFEAFCAARIFEPLGLSRTHFHRDHRAVVPGRTRSYGWSGSGWEERILSYAITGATSLFTTVDDLVRWDQNWTTGAVGGAEVQALMALRGAEPDGTPRDYGMGVSHGTYRGAVTRDHSGGDAAYTSHLLAFPEHDVSIAVLANTPIPTARLARQVADVVLADVLADVLAAPPAPAPAAEAAAPNDDADPVALTDDEAARTVGRFACAEPMVLVDLVVRGGMLIAEMNGTPVATLAPTATVGTYTLSGFANGATLAVEAGAPAPALRVTMPDGRTLDFRRLPDLDAAAMDAYVGRYVSPELDVAYRVARNDAGDGLVVIRRKYGTQPLHHVGPDHFIAGEWYEFERAPDGAITGFRISSNRVRNLWFRRDR